MRKGVPLDGSGETIPWYSYPAVEFLDSIDLRDFRIFEWGSGYSTEWWLRRASNVVAIEDDPDWFATVRSRLAGTAGLDLRLLESHDEYVRSFTRDDYDIVVIDGSYRSECAEVLVRKLESVASQTAKMIILDNSNWFPKTALSITAHLGWHRVDFGGPAAAIDYGTVTTVYLNPRASMPFRRAPRTATADIVSAKDDTSF